MEPRSEPVWFIKVRESVYGPYDEERMRIFANEGRLGARSQVCTDKDGVFLPASDDAGLADILAQPRTEKNTNNRPALSRRFVIFAQISQHSRVDFMETLSGFGVAIEAMPDVWLLKAQARAASLRNAMSKVLGSEDVLFITDASKGKSAWFNVGQETDNRIRQFWQDSE